MAGIVILYILTIISFCPIILIVDLLMDFRLSNFAKKILKSYSEKSKIRKLKQSEKSKIRKLKQKEKRLEKSNSSLCYDALKFEYSEIYNIVNNVIKRMHSEQFEVNESYLIYMHKYFKEILKIRDIKRDSVEFLACLHKALCDNNVFCYIQENSFKSGYELKENKILMENIIVELKANYKNLYYNNELITASNKREIIIKCSIENIECKSIHNIYDSIKYLIEEYVPNSTTRSSFFDSIAW